MNLFFYIFLIYIVQVSFSLYLPPTNGRYTRNITNYELTIPKQIINGKTLNGVISQWYLRDSKGLWWRPALNHNRQKRNYRIEPPWCSFIYKFKDQNVVLDLWPNNGLMSPHLAIERYVEDKKIKVPVRKRQCYFVGGIRGEKGSRVAVNLCYGMTGYIINLKHILFIEPHESSVPDENGAIYLHILHQEDKKELKNRVTRSISNKFNFCGTNDGWKKAWLNASQLAYQSNKLINKRFVSKHRYLEILTVADKKFIEYHKNIDKETYILTILNMASYFYHDSSVGNMIDFVAVKIIYLEKENEMELEISHDAEKSLPSFCKWQQKVNSPNGSPQHHDIAILLTRYDICSDGGTECQLLGLANVATACDPKLACSINEDTGLMLGLTVTHEVGHILGCSHDKVEISGCSPEAPDGTSYMMAPYADMYTYSWSPCSRKYITSFLDNVLGDCLLNPPPSPSPYRQEQMPPGANYDADFQCRTNYGPKASECKIEGKICETLFCKIGSDETNCKSKGNPYADGTTCGPNKWCMKKKCVVKGQRPEALDGGWGEWGPMSTCSRTCGGGVAISERECNNPQPANLGRYCLGDRIKYEICNIQPCKENSISFRQQQCSEFNDKEVDGQKFKWRAFIMAKPGTDCELGCMSDVGAYKALKPRVIDGTPCKAGTRNVCVAGVCKSVGCDWTLDSKVIEDQCGICGGNGVSCVKKEGEYTESKGGYQKIIEIPKKSTKIKLEQNKPSDGNIAVAFSDEKNFLLNGFFSQNATGEFESAGTIIVYHQPEEEKDLVEIPGPTNVDLVAMYVKYDQPNPGVKWSFYQFNPDPNYKPSYHWEFLDWSECSMLCGGGVEKSDPSCVEKISGKVADQFCLNQTDLTKSEPLTRACNPQPCKAKWKLGQWGECKGCLFRSGWRLRNITCIVEASRTQVEPSEVDIKECPTPKPPTAKLCNAVGHCPPKNLQLAIRAIKQNCDKHLPLINEEILKMKNIVLKRQTCDTNGNKPKSLKNIDKVQQIEKEYKEVMKTMMKDSAFNPKTSIIIDKPAVKPELEVDISVQENNLKLSDLGYEKLGDSIVDNIQVSEIRYVNSSKPVGIENETDVIYTD